MCVNLYLNVRLGECDHLWQDVDHVQVLHFVPGSLAFVKDVNTIGALVRLTIVYNVGDEIVDSVRVELLIFLGKELAHVDVFNRKVDNRRILLNEESVLSESLQET